MLDVPLCSPSPNSVLRKGPSERTSKSFVISMSLSSPARGQQPRISLYQGKHTCNDNQELLVWTPRSCLDAILNRSDILPLRSRASALASQPLPSCTYELLHPFSPSRLKDLLNVSVGEHDDERITLWEILQVDDCRRWRIVVGDLSFG